MSVCGNHLESWNAPRQDTPYPVPWFDWTAADGEMIGAFKQLGIEPGRMPISRFRKCMATGTCKYCPIGGRFTAQQVVDGLRGNPRYTAFKVLTRSPVTQILVTPKGRKITGVEYLNTSTGETRRVLAKVVVVCSGAYESPKLLMLSTSHAWPKGIGNHHDLVGRYIVSHSMLVVEGEKTATPLVARRANRRARRFGRGHLALDRRVLHHSSLALLAGLWTAAWKQGGGNSISNDDLVAFDEDDLVRIYRKERNFVPSLSLNEMVKSEKFEV